MKRVLMLALLVLASACGSDTPVAPAPVIPNYAGNWSGTYTITGCNQIGSISQANLCGTLGAGGPYALSLQQSQRSVTGFFTLGAIQFPSTGGTVGGDGGLALSSTTIASGVSIVGTWALSLPANALTGTITEVWTSTTLSGQVNVSGTISTANRTTDAGPRVTLFPRARN